MAKKKSKRKKGSLGLLVPMILMFVVAVIVSSTSGQILGQIQSTQTTNSVPYNVTGYGLTGLTTLGSFYTTIATVIGAVVVISLVLMIGVVRTRRE